MSSRAVADAWKSAVTTKLQTGTSPPVLGSDLRPAALYLSEAQALQDGGALPKIHAVISLVRRPGSLSRVSSGESTTGWYLSATCVGTSVREAMWAIDRVEELRGSRITVTGYDLTPLKYYNDTAPELDDGRYSGIYVLTSVSTPA